MTMNQESTKKNTELDPIDLEPITNHSLIDFILLTRDRYAFAVAVWVTFFLIWPPVGVALLAIDVFVSRGAYKIHKKEEDKMNKIKQELWKIKLQEMNFLSQF